MAKNIYMKKSSKETIEDDSFDTLIREALIKLNDKELEVLGEPEDEPTPARMTYEEIMEEIFRDVTYEDLPDRKGDEFIQLAIRVSEENKFDIEIKEFTESIMVNISFDGSKALEGDFKRLISMADDMEIFSKIHNRDVTINLQYYTKAVYRRGRLMFP